MGTNMFMTARRGLPVLMVKVFEALIGAVAAIGLGRILGAEPFGIYALGLAIVTIASIPVKVGVSAMITKEIAVSDASLGQGRAKTSIILSIALSIAFSFLLFILYIFSIYFINNLTYEYKLSILIFAISLPASCIVGIFEGVLRGYFRPTISVIVGNLIVPCTMVAYVIIGLGTPQIVDWRYASAIYVCAVFFSLVVGWAAAAPHLKVVFASPAERDRPIGHWLKSTAPFIVSAGLLVFNRQIDLVIVAILGSESDAGIYRISAQAAILTTFGVQAISHYYAPHLSSNKTADNAQYTGSILRTSMALSIMFATAVTFALILFGGSMLTLAIGEEFSSGYLPMIILCLANIAVAANGAIPQALMMRGQQAQVMRIYCLSAIITVGANSLLVPIYGATGAALGTGLAVITWAIMLRMKACRTWRLSFYLLREL